MNLRPATLQQIDEVITHYPVKRSATLPLLHLVQEDAGWISKEAIEWIAAKLELPPINVYEVVTFYPMFRQAPDRPPPHQGLPHALLRARRRLQGVRAVPAGIWLPPGRGLHDGEVTIDFVECLASCGTGPVVMIDDDLHEKVDTAKVKALSDGIRQAAKTGGKK
ncbi:MAG: NAD(P)H-dependent oxidoreductase subunit E [Lacunisphaera sp.]